MDFVVIYYILFCVLGALLVLALNDWIADFEKKWVRITIRLGLIFALPLMLLAMYFSLVFEIGE